MDDKYRKEYERKSQLHKMLEKQWAPKKEQQEWQHEQINKTKKPKPDPATVEAELQLEEQLWAS